MPESNNEKNRGDLIRSRISKWEDAADDGFLFFFGVPSIALVAAIAKVFFDVSVSQLSFGDGGFWVIVIAAFLLAIALQKTVFAVLRARARAKYPAALANSDHEAAG